VYPTDCVFSSTSHVIVSVHRTDHSAMLMLCSHSCYACYTTLPNMWFHIMSTLITTTASINNTNSTTDTIVSSDTVGNAVNTAANANVMKLPPSLIRKSTIDTDATLHIKAAKSSSTSTTGNSVNFHPSVTKQSRSRDRGSADKYKMQQLLDKNSAALLFSDDATVNGDNNTTTTSSAYKATAAGTAAVLDSSSSGMNMIIHCDFPIPFKAAASSSSSSSGFLMANMRAPPIGDITNVTDAR
jgi:hypothetical protein